MGRVFVGIVLVILGVGLALDATGRYDFGATFGLYWPSLLILFGLFRLAVRPQYPGFPILLILVGAFFQADRLGKIPSGWPQYVWPALLILLGLLLILGSSRRQSRMRVAARWGTNLGRDVDRTAFLGGFKERVTTSPFRAGRVAAVLGSAEVDLREATPHAQGAHFEASATLGSVVLRVPTAWHVQLDGTPFLGSVQDRRGASTPGEGAPRLVVRATSLLGSIEVRD